MDPEATVISIDTVSLSISSPGTQCFEGLQEDDTGVTPCIPQMEGEEGARRPSCPYFSHWSNKVRLSIHKGHFTGNDNIRHSHGG